MSKQPYQPSCCADGPTASHGGCAVTWGPSRDNCTRLFLCAQRSRAPPPALCTKQGSPSGAQQDDKASGVGALVRGSTGGCYGGRHAPPPQKRCTLLVVGCCGVQEAHQAQNHLSSSLPSPIAMPGRPWPSQQALPELRSCAARHAHCWQCKKPTELLMPSCSVTLQACSVP